MSHVRGASALLTVGRAPSGWTAAYLGGLPVTGYRYELQDGALLLGPPPPAWHERLAGRLVKAFEAGLWPALAAAALVFGPRSVRVADVAAFTAIPEPAARYHRPEVVAAAAEIVEPGSESALLSGRHLRYAQAGIPEYWRVEPDPVDRSDAVVTVHRLTLGERGAAYAVERVRRLSVLERDGVGA